MLYLFLKGGVPYDSKQTKPTEQTQSSFKEVGAAIVTGAWFILGTLQHMYPKKLRLSSRQKTRPTFLCRAVRRQKAAPSLCAAIAAAGDPSGNTSARKTACHGEGNHRLKH